MPDRTNVRVRWTCIASGHKHLSDAVKGHGPLQLRSSWSNPFMIKVSRSCGSLLQSSPPPSPSWGHCSWLSQ
eukprot:2269024-Heterocapsa_arctica.AAC.1